MKPDEVVLSQPQETFTAAIKMAETRNNSSMVLFGHFGPPF